MKENPGETVFDVFAELKVYLNDMAGAHWFATDGLRQQSEVWRERNAHHDKPDATVWVGIGSPTSQPFVPYHSWPMKQLPDRLLGPVSDLVGHQWVVAVYTAWESEYRPRALKAMGQEEGQVWPLMGDLRLLRNDIVHHRGIATKNNSGRCKDLADWVTVGQVISLSKIHVADFMMRAGLAEVQTPPPDDTSWEPVD